MKTGTNKMKKIFFLLFISFSNNSFSESNEYRLGEKIAAITAQCFRLNDLSKRICPRAPKIEIDNCLNVSLNFLPEKTKNMFSTALKKPDQRQKFTLNAEFINDLSFAETLKENKSDKSLACSSQYSAIIYLKKTYTNEALELVKD